MSEPALSLALFDPGRQLSVSARSGATLVFEGRSPRILPSGPQVFEEGGGWRFEQEQSLSVSARPLADVADLGDGLGVHFCAIRGEVGGEPVDCLGTVGETERPPEWEQLDAVRTVSALFDERTAAIAVARRPRDAAGHGAERLRAWVLEEGMALNAEEARLSTVYDGDGRQRSAGLEIFIADEDFPRRLAGTVSAGSSLAMEGLDVHAAVFSWRMDGHEGTGEYELWSRAPTPQGA